jgi:hypothetical protein
VTNTAGKRVLIFSESWQDSGSVETSGGAFGQV